LLASKLEKSWHAALEGVFDTQEMQSLVAFLSRETKAGKQIYPAQENIFKAFELTPFANVKVVIVGQDPYHGPGQAHGLSFSVLPGVKIPPSLRNIYKELDADLGVQRQNNGCLDGWARQGVLLLNAVLSVEAGQAASHQKRGWEWFTDQVIKRLAEEKEGLVFILWGNYALEKGKVIDRKRHMVLNAVHPSPLSANRGFFGSRPFSKVNDFLKTKKIEPIDWSL
jgi:uracil-DNA glycosylase